MMQQEKAFPPHESAALHVTGRAIYTDDQQQLTAPLYAVPVQVMQAKARIKNIEIEKALDLPGVHLVLLADDVPGDNDTSPLHLHDEPLFPAEVSYSGQAVCWVVAESEEVARAASKAITITLTPEDDAILTIKDAIKHRSYHGEAQHMRRGHVRNALKEAPHTLKGDVEMGGQDHFYLETHASWAVPDGQGGICVTSSTQHPSETQQIIASVLGMSKSQVVVRCERMGGGFGGKESQANPLAAVAALAAYKTGRGVRARLNRTEDMLMTGKRHPFLGVYRVGFDDEGRLLALDLDLYADGGWSSDLSHAIVQRAMFHAINVYHVPHVSVRGWVCKTHKVSNTAFRGFGGPQGMVVIETIIDRIARTLELAPEVVRQRNFAKEGSVTHYGQMLTHVRTQRVWDEVMARSRYSARKAQIKAHNKKNPHYKRGIAITPVQFGISFTTTMLNQAGALVLIYTDGSVQINHGGTEMGQGLHSKVRHVASRALGVDQARIRVMTTATDKVPNTSATAASSGSDLNGQAVKHACEQLKTRLAHVAAEMLSLNAPEALEFADGKVFVASHPRDCLTFDEVVKQAYVRQVSLSASGYYRTPNIYFDKESGQGRPFYYYAYGACVSEVEIDVFTGCWTLRAVDIVHDVGKSLNPLLDRGQIEGGFIQGVGWLTMEELYWDGAGVLRTHAPSTYKIPTISEVPEHFTLHLLEDAYQEGVIYGSKAVGEPPFMLAISVREALREAVVAFGKEGSEVKLAAPATPEAILKAIDSVSIEEAEQVSPRGCLKKDIPPEDRLIGS